MQKVYADKTLKVDNNSQFAVPANMQSDIYLNYDSNVQPGAEAEDQGNGAADDYLDVGQYWEETQPAPSAK